MRLSTKTFALATASIALSPLMGVVPAHADNGDGLEACNYTEICFAKDWTNPNPGAYQKDFYYSARHSDYTWYDTAGNVQTTRNLHDDASAEWNRDSSCSVTLKNFAADGVTLVNSFYQAANRPAWVYVGAGINDKNDRHDRC
jgi:hypothetical protein